MRPLILSAALLLGSIPVVFAHTHLAKTSPADGAVLNSSPSELTFQFSEPTRLTATTVQKEGEKQPIALKSPVKVPATKVELPLESVLTPGKYVVTWRAIGADNHVMSGKHRFTIVAR